MTLPELLVGHKVNEHRELTNGGIAFAFRGHRIEVYEGRPGVFILAYNSDPPDEGCWEFWEGTVAQISEQLKTPEALWGW